MDNIKPIILTTHHTLSSATSSCLA